MWKAQTFKGSNGNVNKTAQQTPAATSTANDDDDWDTGTVVRFYNMTFVLIDTETTISRTK